MRTTLSTRLGSTLAPLGSELQRLGGISERRLALIAKLNHDLRHDPALDRRSVLKQDRCELDNTARRVEARTLQPGIARTREEESMPMAGNAARMESS